MVGCGSCFTWDQDWQDLKINAVDELQAKTNQFICIDVQW
jgi:hypothetical protein